MKAVYRGHNELVELLLKAGTAYELIKKAAFL